MSVLDVLYELGLMVLACLGLALLTRHLRRSASKSHMMLISLFCFYIAVVYHLTGMPTLSGITLFYQMNWLAYLNVHLFRQGINILGYGLNLFLFIPFGVFLPLLWAKYRSFYHVLFAGVAFSAFIEICQMLNDRITDVDDLLMNSIGTVIGYFLYDYLSKRVSTYEPSSLFSPFCYIICLFLIRFIFFNEWLF